MTKNIEIRNSTAEFLIFMLEGKEDGIQVMYKDETIWATQKAIAQDRKSTRLNSSHSRASRMPSSA